MENDNDKETRAAAEKWHLHQAQEIIDSLVRVEEPASKSLNERAAIETEPGEPAEWAYDLRDIKHDLDGSVTPEDIEAIGHVCLKLIQRYAPEGRGVRFMEVWARAWQRVLIQGIHDLQCDASGNELGLMEWIVTGKEPEVKR
jgi:hypothetical protein